jgi:hypothetical protein
LRLGLNSSRPTECWITILENTGPKKAAESTAILKVSFILCYFSTVDVGSPLLKCRNRQLNCVKIIFDVHTSKASKELKVVLLHLWRVNVKTTRGFITIRLDDFHIYKPCHNIFTNCTNNRPRQCSIYIFSLIIVTLLPLFPHFKSTPENALTYLYLTKLIGLA